MTKVMIEVPENLHRFIKIVASSKGETMKHFVLRAIESLVKQEARTEISNSNNQEFITEEEADNLLKPYLSAIVADIEKGSEKVMDSKTFFGELAKS